MNGWYWTALALYVVGLALAFGVRSWLQWRATGSTGFHGVSGRPGSPAWWGGILFVIALVLGVAAPILAMTGTTPPLPLLAHTAVGTAGLALAILGLVITLAAQHAMGTSWRIGVDEAERTDLVTTGLFQWVRNPIFTGMATVSVGVVLMVPTLAAALSLACLIGAVQIQVRVTEESYLLRAHGQAYVVYCAGAGRFLPRLLRTRARPSA